MENPSDNELIRQLFDNVYQAWNTGEGKLYASYFSDNCDYVTFLGEHLKGSQSVADTHQQLFDSFAMRGSQLTGHMESIRFLSSDIAVVHATGVVKLRFQKKAPKGRQSINTNIVVRQNGQWKISVFHNCRIKKPSFIQKIFTKDGNKK